MAPKNPLLFFGGIVLAIICIALTIYYVLPAHYMHLFASNPYGTNVKHAVAFAVIAVICLLVAAINRPRPSVVR